MRPFSNVLRCVLLTGALAVAPSFAQSSATPGTTPSGAATSTGTQGSGTTGTPTTGTSPYSNPTGNGYAGTNQNNGSEQHNFGWIGLVGLAGLAGLFRGNRHTDDRTTTTTSNDRLAGRS
jgi:hypothetical protein